MNRASRRGGNNPIYIYIYAGTNKRSDSARLSLRGIVTLFASDTHPITISREFFTRISFAILSRREIVSQRYTRCVLFRLPYDENVNRTVRARANASFHISLHISPLLPSNLARTNCAPRFVPRERRSKAFRSSPCSSKPIFLRCGYKRRDEIEKRSRAQTVRARAIIFQRCCSSFKINHHTPRVRY